MQSRSLMLIPNDNTSVKSAKDFHRSKKLNKSFVSNNSDIQNIFKGHDLSAHKIYGDVIAGPSEAAIYNTQPVRRTTSMPPRSPSPIFGRKKLQSSTKKKSKSKSIKIDRGTLQDYKDTCDYLEQEIQKLKRYNNNVIQKLRNENTSLTNNKLSLEAQLRMLSE